jgi:putative heme-binding domain-containing protein
MILFRRVRLGALLMAWFALSVNPLRANPQMGQDAAIANPSAQDIDQGKQTFETRCSTCHGLDGGGAMGPNIQGTPFRLGAPAVINTIKNGMAGGMPAFSGQLDSTQINQLVAYLLSLKRVDEAKVTGDPDKGKEIYDSSDCASCHIISGQGGDIGPELTQVGKLRGPGYLRNTILYPGTDLPQAQSFLESGGQLQYLFIHVVTNDGRTVDGTRVAEDSFHIVLRDAKGGLHSFRKADIRELDKEPGKSTMPSYKGTLSDAQVDDLVAYLASLKGAQ